MTDIAYRFKQGGRGVYGVPQRDITVAEFEAMPPNVRRAVKSLDAYEAVAEAPLDDPLRALTNEDYAQLAPAEKAARTREAKRAAQDGKAGEGDEE